MFASRRGQYMFRGRMEENLPDSLGGDIQPGDRIVAVDGKSTEGYTPDEARETLRGPEGSKVSITVDRPGVEALLPFTLQRAEIHVASVRHPTMLASDIGYVDLTIFSESSDSELVSSDAPSVKITTELNHAGSHFSWAYL